MAKEIFSPQVASDESLAILQQEREVPIATLAERFDAQMDIAAASMNMTTSVNDFIDQMLWDDTDTLTAQEADALYPIGEPRTENISRRQAERSYNRYKEMQDAQMLLSGNTPDGTPSTVVSLLSSLGAGIVADPILMATSMLGGMALESTAVGTRLSTSIYNTIASKGASRLGAAAAIGGTEAIMSAAFDVPLEMGLAIAEQYNPTAIEQYTVKGSMANIALGAMFSGGIGSILGGYSGAGKAVMDRAASIRHIAEKTALYAEGVYKPDVTSVRQYLDSNYKDILEDFDTGKLTGVDGNGRVYTTDESMVKIANMDDITFVNTSEFTKVADGEALDLVLDVAKRKGFEEGDILQVFETNSIADALNSMDGEVLKDLRDDVLKEVQARYGDDVIFGDYKIGEGTAILEPETIIETPRQKIEEAYKTGDVTTLRQYEDIFNSTLENDRLRVYATSDQIKTNVETNTVQKALEYTSIANSIREASDKALMDGLKGARPLYDIEYPAAPNRVDITKAFETNDKPLEASIEFFLDDPEAMELAKINLETAAYVWDNGFELTGKEGIKPKAGVVKKAWQYMRSIEPTEVAKLDLEYAASNFDKIKKQLEKEVDVSKNFDLYKKLFNTCNRLGI